MRAWGGLAAVTLGVSACGGLPLDGGGPAQNEIVVTSDRVILRGPEGFCVDTESSSHRPAEAFIVFGNCAAIAGDEEQPQPFVSAVAVATVFAAGAKTPSIADSEVALAQFFQTDAARVALSASGEASTVEILDSFSRNGAFFVHARDTGTGRLPGTSDTYWRGYFDVKNSLVAVSVIGLEGVPLSSSDGLQTLYGFGNAIMDGQQATAPAPKSSDPNDVQNTGLLRRLFG